MKIFLDTADVSLIGPAYDTGLLDGVTTNPTLILKSLRDPYEAISDIAVAFPDLKSISAEVVADTATEMLEQAVQYHSISDRVTIKVPCTVEGLKACFALSKQGVTTNVTLVFSVAQAILSAKAGATYVSPFVGRWMDNSVDGVSIIKGIREVYDQGFQTSVLAASIRDVHTVELCAKHGADVVTVPPTVFWSMYKNVMTDRGLDLFQKDWDSIRCSGAKKPGYHSR